MLACEPGQSAIERGGDQIRQHRRGRRALRQAVAVRADLRQHGGCLRRHAERRGHEQPAHAAEIDTGKEIGEIDVQHPALAGVASGIADDAAADDEAVRARMPLIDLLEHRQQLVLLLAHEPAWRADQAHAAGALGDLEMIIAAALGRAVERVDQAAHRHVEKRGDVLRAEQPLPCDADGWQTRNRQ